MTADTVLTEDGIYELKNSLSVIGPNGFFYKVVRGVEQAVLQSPEIQALRKDAERLDWMDNVAHCADWVEEEPTKRVIRADDGAEFQGDTWRAAIDAAMQEEKT